jgi:LPXTG-site transpeptidase (sortase) family protein
MQIGTRQLRTPGFKLPRLPKPQTRVGKILRGILPLIIIAVLTYLLFNFPAILNRLSFWVHPPKPGNTRLLPATVNGPSEIPAATSACGNKPVPYDGAGNPTAICDNYVYIPKIRVAAPIVYPKDTSDASINDQLLKGVVHYPGTADPGQRGNIFLTGHSSYYWWAKSDYKTIFSLVPQLIGGDEIIIYNKGIRYTYRVTQVKEVSPTDVSVLRPTSDPVVTLSTCVPIGTSYRRRIVRAAQVSPDPASARSSNTNAPAPTRLPGVR